MIRTHGAGRIGAILLTLALTAPAVSQAHAGVPAGFRHDLARHPSCPVGFRIIGTRDCTHGPDGPPAGTDRTARAEPIDFGGTLGPTPVFCFDDGTSGPRVQVVYVRYAGGEDRYAEFRDSFRQWTADADAIFADSALATRGLRRVRFVTTSATTSACRLVVERATIPVGSGVGAGLKPQGFDRTDRKYLVFLDSDREGACGYAGTPLDDKPGPTNKSNQGPTFAVVKPNCGWNGKTAAHELMHTIGGVQLSAPHSSGGLHCTDEYDRMCYSDTPDHPAMDIVCTPKTTYDRLFDCNHDDYFSTAPGGGSYLDTHWNPADSRFLERGSSHWVISSGGGARWLDWRISSTSLSTVAFADLDGDGRDDAFRARSGRWEIASGAREEWQVLAAPRDETVSQLLFGDFDEDGRADALRSRAGRWEISGGAHDPWEFRAFHSEPVSGLRVADFDGDGHADVLRATGSQLEVAWSAAGAWQAVKTSAIAVSSLRVGDFDGDGNADVFYRGSGGTWNVSYSNASRDRWTLWTQVGSSSAPLDTLAFGRFNSDDTVDIFRTSGGKWMVSYSTTDRSTWSRWTQLNTSVYTLADLRFADVDGGRTDVIRYRP